MFSPAALTAGLALAVSALVVSSAEVYMLAAGFSYTSLPYATVTAVSITHCSISCANMDTGDCNGFRFLPGGACLLYLDEEPPVSSAGPEDSVTTAVPDQPATYRKQRDNADPMSLTTTTTTATTTSTQTTTTVTTTVTTTGDATSPVGPTTGDATIPAATPAATPTAAPEVVTDGAVTLQDMSVEAEWPCDAAITEVFDQALQSLPACEFLPGYASNGTSTMWRSVSTGHCDIDRGRCSFPAILSTDAALGDTGAPRIEAWRSAGHFQFDMGDDFPTPPADLTDTYNAGPATAGSVWKYDCSTFDSTFTVLTGFLGVYRDEDFQANIPRDLDLILCTRFTDIHLQVDPAQGAVLDVSNNGDFRCPANHVLTGVWSFDKLFKAMEKVKCSKLISGTVNVDDPACVMTGRHAASNTAIYWNACVQETGPFVATGLRLSDVTDAAGSVRKQWDIRCCPGIEPRTVRTEA